VATKIPVPRRSGTATKRHDVALRIAEALSWDTEAMDAMSLLLEKISAIRRRKVSKTNQNG
jgi:hypothetical protein